MNAKFAGRCRDCGKQFPAGEQINWSKLAGARHVSCGTSAAGEYREIAPGAVRGSIHANAEAAEGRRDKAHMDAEYAKGVADADRYIFNRDTFGEDYAAAEELAWELKDPDGSW